MTRLTIGILALIVGLTMESAEAQRPSAPGAVRSRRPTTSPYLNLLNRGGRRGGIGFQYFQRVRPEQEFRRNNEKFAKALRAAQQGSQKFTPQQQRLTGRRSITGHSTGFFTYSSYYRFGPNNQ